MDSKKTQDDDFANADEQLSGSEGAEGTTEHESYGR